MFLPVPSCTGFFSPTKKPGQQKGISLTGMQKDWLLDAIITST